MFMFYDWIVIGSIILFLILLSYLIFNAGKKRNALYAILYGASIIFSMVMGYILILIL